MTTDEKLDTLAKDIDKLRAVVEMTNENVKFLMAIVASHEKRLTYLEHE
jgi:hypothetical protein